MSKKRGLSLEEKKTRMLQIFYESNEFYQLKELEKIAPKEKGITSQSVKEVIQMLVDDHFVVTEKIGTSIYFWAFAGNARNIVRRKIIELEKECEDCDSKLEQIKIAIENAKMGRELSEERSGLLQKLENIKEKANLLKSELEKYRDSDPLYMTQLSNEIQEIKSGINRWTENIYILKSYCKDKFMMEDMEINKSFNIPNEMDFIN